MKNVRTARGEVLNFEELIIKESLKTADTKKESIVQQIRQNPSGLTMEMFSKLSNTGVNITPDDVDNVKDVSNAIVDIGSTKRKIVQPTTEKK